MTEADPMATAPAPAFEPVLSIGESSLLGGLLGGIVGAIAATSLWYAVVALSGWQVGLVAIVVGLIVGYAVVFGAGGRGSIPLVLVSAVLTLAALVVSEYLIVYHFVAQTYGTEGLTPIVQAPDFVAGVALESVQEDPVTLLFWGFALFQAVAIPFRAIRARG
jgi:hypothetical protein